MPKPSRSHMLALLTLGAIAGLSWESRQTDSSADDAASSHDAGQRRAARPGSAGPAASGVQVAAVAAAPLADDVVSFSDRVMVRVAPGADPAAVAADLGVEMPRAPGLSGYITLRGRAAGRPPSCSRTSSETLG